MAKAIVFYLEVRAAFKNHGNVTVVGGVAPGGANVVGAVGMGGVTGGVGGVTGTTFGTIGALGE